MVDTKNQYLKIKDEIDSAIKNVIDSSLFIQGPAVKEFENNVQNYLGAKHAIGCASGTDALQIAMMAANIKPGDEIITTPFTFVATTETIALLGAAPVYVDINPDTFNIDTSKIEEKITPKTKAIIPVHLYGQPCDMDQIMEISQKYNLYVIEDAAQAMGSLYKGQKVCTIGDMGCISYYPSKNLGAFGDAGMITTNNDELAEKIRMITAHGSKRKYYHEILGINSRLDSIQAALLNVKLKYLDSYSDARFDAAMKYNEKFKNYFKTPYILPDVKHIFHQYSIRVKNRDKMIEFLKQNGIPSMIYYPVPLHLQKAYKYSYKQGDFPVSEEIANDIISLPMHTELDNEQIDYISSKVIEFNNMK
ncbi:MAG: DegT/DnrJ/EryC1/StrS family aminotransferase [Ignavibacteria bacterium]|nr:DegT/DnrJ/EryC1/StrS family aminotransferase [Ignavibacteria bacterium]